MPTNNTFIFAMINNHKIPILIKESSYIIGRIIITLKSLFIINGKLRLTTTFDFN